MTQVCRGLPRAGAWPGGGAELHNWGVALGGPPVTLLPWLSCPSPGLLGSGHVSEPGPALLVASLPLLAGDLFHAWVAPPAHHPQVPC